MDESPAQILYRFIGVESAVRELLRQHGTLTAYGRTFLLDVDGSVLMAVGEFGSATHAADLGPDAALVTAAAGFGVVCDGKGVA